MASLYTGYDVLLKNYYNDMITLEKEFTSGEGALSTSPRIYKQIARSAKAAIYSRTIKKNGKPEGFEVFKISVKPKGSQIFDKILEDDTEEYPSTGKFGHSAWHVMTDERAREIFKRLNDEADEKENPSVKDEIVIPLGEWSVKDLAEKNGIEYPKAFIFLKGALGDGKVKFLREERRNAKGKMSKIYTKA